MRDARSAIAVLLALAVVFSIVGPIGAKLLKPEANIAPDTVTGLLRLVDTIAGGLIVYLSGEKKA